MEKLVSVIVPIYNVDKYLEECLNSIVNQSYKNLEIILVDDGSTDRCPMICDEFQKKDSRVKVIHKENGGVAEARNIGLKNVKGDYISFIDPDDYVEKCFIRELVDALEKNNAEMSICSAKKVDDLENILQHLNVKNKKLISGKEAIAEFEKYPVTNTVLWNKLYKKELFSNIVFPKGKIHEDEAVIYKVLYKANVIAVINKELYFYRYYKKSITNKKFNDSRIDIIDIVDERLEFFKKLNENYLYELTYEHYLTVIIDVYVNTRKYINNSKKLQKQLINKFKTYYKNIGIIRAKKNKIKFKIFNFCPMMWYLIKK